MAGIFVGREEELSSIASRLETTRFVTLLGLGGVGKTRLAHEVALRTPSRRTFVCDLSGATNTEDICSAVATALGIGLAVLGEDGARIEAIGHALRSQSDAAGDAGCLLVLDETEAIASVLGPAIDRWLEIAKAAHFIVTSRVRIGSASEQVIPIEPLPISRTGGSSEAERLFVERARAAGAKLVEADMPNVRRLVETLEGIPLAIELAAAWGRILPVSDLLARVVQGEEIRAMRSDDPRHSTMRQVIAGSFNLLREDERAMLTAAACFRGGFSLQSAEAMVGPRALELLQSLVDASMVRPASSAEAGARFDLFETVRSYALERLHENPEHEAALIRRHAEHMASAASSWRTAAAKIGGREYLARLARDHDNLTFALTRLLDRPSLDARETILALTLVVELEPIRMLRGHARTYVAWARAALAALPEDAQDPSARSLRLAATLSTARALSELGEAQESAQTFERAVDLALKNEDLVAEGHAHCGLARLDAHGGSWQKALERFSKAKVCAIRASNEGLLQVALASASFYGSELSDSEEQLIPIEKATEYFREIGDERESLLWAVQLGRAYTDFDRADKARTRLQESLERARAIGDRRTEGFALFGLGGLHLSESELEDAAAAYTEAIGILAEVGKERDRGYALGYLGLTEHMRKRYREVEAAYTAGAKVLAAVGDVPNAALFTLLYAGSEADQDRVGESMAIFRTAQESAKEWAGSGMRPLVGELVGALIDSAQARIAERRADLQNLAKYRQAAESRLELARATPEHIISRRQDYDWRDVSLDVRMAWRLAQRAVETIRLPSSCFSITANHMKFRTHAGGEWVDLGTRRVLRQVLGRLIEERLSSPGRVVGASDLVAAGWPGERLAPDAAANRLHVALGTLRKLGLAELIERASGGWRMRAEIPILTVEEEQTAS